MISKDLVAASAKPLILSILAEGENYGYAIIQRVRQLSGDKLQWSEGMLYPVLHRLEREGLISAQWQQGETGRERKYYRLAQDGRHALAKEKADWLTVHHALAILWKTRNHST